MTNRFARVSFGGESDDANLKVQVKEGKRESKAVRSYEGFSSSSGV